MAVTLPFGPPLTAKEAVRPVALGRYDILDILGQGGFGSVYLGFDTDLRRKVAIKVPRYEGLDALGGAVQFLQEARRLAKLNHPGIVKVYDVGVDAGRCYIVSEYIEGTSLSAWLKKARPSFEQTTGIVMAVADALAYAHAHGVVHRDVKPGNILLTSDCVPIVVDFGLALSEEEAAQAPRYRTVGTPPYSSPEQERGEGHRIDGRTDIYSLGVVLYQMLSGRLPFRSDELDELRRQICEDDPQPPRQFVGSIPRELERICMKAMAKRISDRYSTAADLAEELRLAAVALPKPMAGDAQMYSVSRDPAARPSQASGSTIGGSAIVSDTQQPIRIVPKGLRAFGPEDSEFFLELLPGPRDRNGLPDSIRFWKQRIESTDAEGSFVAALVYGPSGCGKSSMMKAGLLPRLDGRIISIYVEATRDDTESRLARGLRKACPHLDPAQSLRDMLATVRRGRALPDGRKLLIVLDQFEQWLHEHGHDMERAELVAALRQADGEHVQVIAMVRDDFWLGASRFFDCLEVNLDRELNTRFVDLLDLRHARRVLFLLGQAFGALPEKRSDLTHEQKAFLENAASELSQDGRVIPVRLSLFAELMKDRSWTQESLVQVGGTQGIGVRFLEETFTARTANPDHRALERPARAVLQALLPDGRTDIKGHMRSRENLAAACGLASDSPRFARLIHILDQELRIITPTEAEPRGASEDREAHDAVRPPGRATAEQDPTPLHARSGSYYQLTHDYLVPPLRQWLTLERRKTWRGRAELWLEERTAQMSQWPQSQYLPSPGQYLSIVLAVPRRKRRPEQRALMRQATWHFGTRGGATLLVALLLAFAGQETLSRLRHSQDQRIEARIDSVLGSSADVVQQEIAKLDKSALPRLREKFAMAPAGSDAQLHAALALAALGEPDEQFLMQTVGSAAASERENILSALRPLKSSVVPKLLERMTSESDATLRAGCAITLLDLGDARGAQNALELKRDPSVRTAFIHSFSAWHSDLSVVAELLSRDLAATLRREGGHPAFRAGLCVALAMTETQSLAAAERHELVAALTELYTSDPDAGAHSAAGFTLWRWTGERPRLEGTRGPRDGRRWFVNLHGLTMLEIPVPGSFMRPPTSEGAEPQKITVTRPYFVCDQAIPTRLFHEFVQDTRDDPDRGPSRFFNEKTAFQESDMDVAVGNVDWFSAIRFCNWLSDREGRQRCYERHADETKVLSAQPPREVTWEVWSYNPSANGYRLPTAAEWEYAARADTDTPFFFGDDRKLLLDYGWFADNSGVHYRRHAGGEKLPSPWGLFEVYGNTMGWCWDWSSRESAATDPLGPPQGERRVAYGGTYARLSGTVTGLTMMDIYPDIAGQAIGLRVVCGPLE